MQCRVPRLAAWVLAAAFGAAAPAHAFLADDEARKAILELRARVQQLEERLLAERQTLSQQEIAPLRRSLLDLNTQIETLRGEIARLRGQNEQLARDLAETQRRVADQGAAVDKRLRSVEPQKVQLDGREFFAEPDEVRQFDAALALLRGGDFAAAATGFDGFLQRWPKSGYLEPARFWLGNAQYGLGKHREAIASFRSLIAAHPQSPQLPEALLAIGNAQIELKDARGARRTLEELVKTHPRSDAAQAARERLLRLK